MPVSRYVGVVGRPGIPQVGGMDADESAEAERLTPPQIRWPPEGIQTVQKNSTRHARLSFFRNLRTTRKLMVGFAAMAVLMVTVGGLGIARLASANANMQVHPRPQHDGLEPPQ